MIKKSTTTHLKTIADVTFGYSFPAIRGIQANREYYVSMCPIRLIPKIFLFNSEELPPDMRAQRTLNRTRLPDMINYIINNPTDYVLSAITASIDGEVKFTPLTESGKAGNHGVLNVSMEARFIINDGQHRRAAIERALAVRPEIGDETIAVVFFLDPRLQRCQQMFADLNRYAVRTSPSIGILYDHRDGQALLTKQLLLKAKIFKNLVELERTTLSQRSRKLFTLSAIYGATNDLLSGMDKQQTEKLVVIASDFWEEIAKVLKDWRLVYQGKLSAGVVRKEYIHSHAVVLQALGRAGNTLIRSHPRRWKSKLLPLGNIDWHRENPMWEGRAMIGGRVSKAQQNVILVTNYIKKKLNLPLSPEEKKTEDIFTRNR